MSRRTWIKIHCEPWLDKTVRKLNLAERGAWITLLTICGNGNYGDIGVIAGTYLSEETQNDGQICPTKRCNCGISVHQMALSLDISVKQTKRYLDRFVHLEMITIDGDNVIRISNWTKYQSEYNRQKSYRQGYKQSDNPKLHTESKKESKKKDKDNLNAMHKDISSNKTEPTQAEKNTILIKLKLLEKHYFSDIANIKRTLQLYTIHEQITACEILLKYKPEHPIPYIRDSIKNQRQQNGAKQSMAESKKHKNDLTHAAEEFKKLGLT